MKPAGSFETFSSLSNNLGMHKDSHPISKPRPPKIRIIHIFAPEIIKTDVENFRGLVQRLTGKPQEKTRPSKKSNPTSSSISMFPPRYAGRVVNENPSKAIKSLEPHDNGRIFHHHHHPPALVQSNTPVMKIMKRENEEFCGGGDNNSHHLHLNSYLHGFGDMDCFNIHDLVGDFPLLPFKSTPQINSFGEMPLC